MAVENPALYIQASEHPAENFRHLITTVMGGQGGVVKSTDLAVTQRGTPNMSVDVAGGTVVILGTEATHQGAYLCHNRGVTNLPISVGDATFTRYDLVVAQVEDADYSGATNAWKLAVIAGTPAATPLFPTVPDNTVVLATVLVPINESTSIDNADITDIRTTSDTDGTTTLRNRGLAPAPGVIVCTSTNRPTTTFTGMEIYEADTGNRRVWSGTIWQWLGGPSQYARVARNSTQNITNVTYEVVEMNVVRSLPTGWSHTAGLITVAEAGLYHVSGQVRWFGNATGDRILALFVESSLATDGVRLNDLRTPGLSTDFTQMTQGMVNLPAGGTVSLQAYHSRGSALAVLGTQDYTHLTVARVS